MGRSQIEVPGAAVLVLAGGVAWLFGTAVLPSGMSTVVLAIGLLGTVWLFREVRRRTLGGPPLHRQRRRRVLRLALAGVGIAAVGSAVLEWFAAGELTIPLTAALAGALLLPLASLVEQRSYLVLGGALMVLGAAGALLALDTAGRLYPQGMVGILAGLMLWAAGAHQAGLLHELQARSRP
jgi:hypothetical protein